MKFRDLVFQSVRSVSFAFFLGWSLLAGGGPALAQNGDGDDMVAYARCTIQAIWQAAVNYSSELYEPQFSSDYYRNSYYTLHTMPFEIQVSRSAYEAERDQLIASSRAAGAPNPERDKEHWALVNLYREQLVADVVQEFEQDVSRFGKVRPFERYCYFSLAYPDDVKSAGTLWSVETAHSRVFYAQTDWTPNRTIRYSSTPTAVTPPPSEPSAGLEITGVPALRASRATAQAQVKTFAASAKEDTMLQRRLDELAQRTVAIAGQGRGGENDACPIKTWETAGVLTGFGSSEAEARAKADARRPERSRCGLAGSAVPDFQPIVCGSIQSGCKVDMETKARTCSTKWYCDLKYTCSYEGQICPNSGTTAQ